MAVERELTGIFRYDAYRCPSCGGDLQGADRALECESDWAVPDPRYPLEYVPLESQALRQARSRLNAHQDARPSTRILELLPPWLLSPLTLGLVFVLLYFSLKSLRDVLLIYTGIPFAAVGGVFALWWRGMPFSVSVAVGFIALTGIAVLNGQILIAAIRSFLEGDRPIHEAVIEAAKQRLRPVLATAITDAVGFVPMALSTGVGAEVQRPLATVVIGGVLTSTLLTLFLLPVLYDLTARVFSMKRSPGNAHGLQQE